MKKYIYTISTLLFCSVAFANERIETDKVAVEFDAKGNLVSFKNKVDNVDYAGGQGLWRVIYQHDKLLEEPVESEEVNATVKKVCDNQINISYDGEFPVEVKCEVKEDDVYFSAKVSNNSKGLICYKNQPYTGKVLGDNNGYLLVRNGVAKNLIICHDNGNIAIDISITNSTMIFKDKNGAQITKEVFLNKYPHFKRITNEWDSVKLK